MPFTTKGNEALSKMYDTYRADYVSHNPGCNENDVERGFLSWTLASFVEMHTRLFAVGSNDLEEVSNLIEEIR